MPPQEHRVSCEHAGLLVAAAWRRAGWAERCGETRLSGECREQQGLPWSWESRHCALLLGDSPLWLGSAPVQLLEIARRSLRSRSSISTLIGTWKLEASAVERVVLPLLSQALC